MSDAPRAGYYRSRQVRRGAWTAVRIWYGPPLDPITGEELDRAPRWQATRWGRECLFYCPGFPGHCGGVIAPGDDVIAWPWAGRWPIDQAEYDAMMAEWRSFGEVYDPSMRYEP